MVLLSPESLSVSLSQYNSHFYKQCILNASTQSSVVENHLEFDPVAFLKHFHIGKWVDYRSRRLPDFSGNSTILS